MPAAAAPNLATPLMPTPELHNALTGRFSDGFRLQFGLFGDCDLFHHRRHPNGSRYTVRRRATSSASAEVAMYLRTCKRVAEGCAPASQNKAWQVRGRKKPTEGISTSSTDIDRFLRNIRRSINDQSCLRKSDDNLIFFFPRSRHFLLNRLIRTHFCNDHWLLQIVFAMEDDGIIFVGDLARLSRDQISMYAGNDRATARFTGFLKVQHLSTEMTIPGWRRPPPFGLNIR